MAQIGSILIAEDDDNDAFLLHRALTEQQVGAPISFVQDGEQVLEYLRGQPPYDNRMRYPMPVLLILDAKMARMSGIEVLEWLQAEPTRRGCPVVVLSGSAPPATVSRALALGADCFLVKPVHTGHWKELAKRLAEFFRKSPTFEEFPITLIPSLKNQAN